MTVLALVLLLLATVSPVGRLGLRRTVDDPTVLVAGVVVLLVALAAIVAAVADPVTGWRRAAALVLGVAVATTGGSDVVRATFRLVRGELRVRPARRREPDPDTEPPTVRLDPAASEPAATGPDPSSQAPAAETILRGGAWIGYLERAAISATVLAAWPSGIALVLAVKGVGRYPELRGPGSAEASAPEAFIIGTLASVLWAAAGAGVATLLVG